MAMTIIKLTKKQYKGIKHLRNEVKKFRTGHNSYRGTIAKNIKYNEWRWNDEII